MHKDFLIKVHDEILTQCPVSLLDEETIELVNIILMSEGGMGGGRVLPSELLDETAFYFNARAVVLSEQRKIEKLKDRKKRKE